MEQLAEQASTMLADLKRDGFSLCPRLSPNFSTVEVARSLGTIVNLEALLPNGGISVVQPLRPRSTSDSNQNRYSGHYGLGIFPLHTDLAHWAVPPRYLLLRCLVGSSDVFTHLFPWTLIVESVGASALRKALFGTRKRRVGCSGLVRAMSHHDGSEILRWDPIFLEPLNRPADRLVAEMMGPAWNALFLKVLLQQPGDTILVDNWRMLHGRGTVSKQSTSRLVERVYLAEVSDEYKSG